MAKKERAPHRADTRGGAWIGIPHCVFKSDAFRFLDPMAKLALLSIMVRLSGWNNGRIAVSYRQIAADHGRKNQAWIGPALAQLVDHGLIDIRMEESWGPRKAREYRLAFVAMGTPDNVIPATNEYLKWHRQN